MMETRHTVILIAEGKAFLGFCIAKLCVNKNLAERFRYTAYRMFSGGQSDELGSGKGEGGSDEDAADTLEAICKCARVLIVAASDVSA